MRIQKAHNSPQRHGAKLTTKGQRRKVNENLTARATGGHNTKQSKNNATRTKPHELHNTTLAQTRQTLRERKQH